MTTALDIITRAAKIIGVLHKSETMDSDESADGLVALNDMIASWSNNSLIIYARTWENFTLAGGTASYLIGTGQTFNTAKPLKIVAAFIRSGGIDYPLQIITDEEYQLGISLKTTQGGPSGYLSYDNAHPYGTIRLYPVPSAADSIYLLTEKAMTAFSALTTTVDLPAGFNEALAYNLAVRLAPEYGMKVTPEIIVTAKESLGSIKLAAAKARNLPYMPSEPMVGSAYTGWYN